MIFWTFLIGIIFGVIIGLTIVYKSAVYPLKKNIEKLTFEKQSVSNEYEKIIEQFEPFMKNYPYDNINFRYVGSPIDGIQFNQDKILFVKFKTSKSKLTDVQNKIKKLIEARKIEWFEFKVK